MRRFHLVLAQVTLSSLKFLKELGISKSSRGRSQLMFLVCPITLPHLFLLIIQKYRAVFIAPRLLSASYVPSPQLLPTRRATSFSTVPTESTVRRTSMQQELFSNTAVPWTCTRPGSSTLSPRAPLTRLSTSWYAIVLMYSTCSPFFFLVDWSKSLSVCQTLAKRCGLLNDLSAWGSVELWFSKSLDVTNYISLLFLWKPGTQQHLAEDCVPHSLNLK